MTPIFRKLRLRFLIENRVSRYLVYAIGEIILVVIGILIALQVNTWNADRKMRILEKGILNEISNDLEADIESLENDVLLNYRIIESIDTVLANLKDGRPLTDSLTLHLGRIAWNTISTVKVSGYENLKNSGFQVMRNDSLRKSISNLYESEYGFLEEIQNLSTITAWEYFIPEFSTYMREVSFISLRPGGFHRKYKPSNFEGLRTDAEFRRLLQYYRVNKQEVIGVIGPILEELRRLKQEVSTEQQSF